MIPVWLLTVLHYVSLLTGALVLTLLAGHSLKSMREK